jgi:recombination associated protein RdgC
MDYMTLIKDKSFLGAEFLTWLLYQSDTLDGRIQLPSGEVVEVWFDDKMTLGADYGNSLQNILKGADPSASSEAMAALSEGKKVTETKLRVVKDIAEWTLNLKAESLDLMGLKIPSFGSVERDAIFYDRITLVEEIDDMLMGLFSLFLDDRLSPDWESRVALAIQEWIKEYEKGRLKAFCPKHNEAAQPKKAKATPATHEPASTTPALAEEPAGDDGNDEEAPF